MLDEISSFLSIRTRTALVPELSTTQQHEWYVYNFPDPLALARGAHAPETIPQQTSGEACYRRKRRRGGRVATWTRGRFRGPCSGSCWRQSFRTTPRGRTWTHPVVALMVLPTDTGCQFDVREFYIRAPKSLSRHRARPRRAQRQRLQRQEAEQNCRDRRLEPARSCSASRTAACSPASRSRRRRPHCCRLGLWRRSTWTT
jgi:hypothetical protein